MYGKDLSQNTFLENVYDDVVKTFFKHFASYIKKCFVNIVAFSPSLTNYARNIVVDPYHYD